MKKTLACIATGTLTIAMGTASLAAPVSNNFQDNRQNQMQFSQQNGLQNQMPGGSQMGPNSQFQKGQQMNSEMGERPELPDGELPELPDGELPELPDGELPELPDGELPELPDGELPELPDGELPQLPDGELPELPDGELPELPDGELPELPNGDMNMEANGPMGHNMINIDDISAAIDSLDDETTKASLEELLDAYQAALESQKEALDSFDIDSDEQPETDAMAEYDEAVISALDSLKAAMEDAGLEIDLPELPEGECPDGECPKEGFESADSNDKNMMSPRDDSYDNMNNDSSFEPDSTSKPSEEDGFFEKIANWFKSLFSK